MTTFPARVTATFALIVVILSGAAAEAGNWTKLERGDKYSACNYLFEGTIEKGDLTGFLETERFEGWNNRVCLNSPGGSLGEVLRVIRPPDGEDNSPTFFMATKIRSGDACLSSCAILFMFGQSVGANSPFPDRLMEPGARLGFHSPFISGEAAARADGGETFRVAIEVAKLLADRSYKAVTTEGAAMPAELLSLILGTPATTMRDVDRVAELKLLNIEMEPSVEQQQVFPLAQQPVFELVRQVCDTSHVLTFRHHYVEDGYDFDDLRAAVGELAQWHDQVEVKHLVLTPKDEALGERIIGVLTGVWNQPGWNSAGSAFYCKVTMEIDRVGDGFRAKFYETDFDLITGTDLSVIPEWSDAFTEISGGLVPIDTPFR